MNSDRGGSQDDEPTGPPITRIIALGLLGLSLLLLFVGNFIQFDDTSGFGSDEWLMPLAPLALLAAGGSLAIALPDVPARRLLGATLLFLDLLIAWQVMTNDGFRFIWSRDEGEHFQLQVVLGLTALALMTKAVYRRSEPAASHLSTETGAEEPSGLMMTGWARFVSYLSATVALVFVAFFMGVAYFESTECSGPDGGECDLAVLGGFVWSAGAILLAAIAVPTIEFTLHAKQRRRG